MSVKISGASQPRRATSAVMVARCAASCREITGGYSIEHPPEHSGCFLDILSDHLVNLSCSACCPLGVGGLPGTRTPPGGEATVYCAALALNR